MPISQGNSQDSAGRQPVDLFDGGGTSITSSTLNGKQALDTTIVPATGIGTIAALNGTVVGIGGTSVTWSLSGTWVGTLTTQAQGGDGQWWNVASLSNQTGLITNSTSINGVLEMNGAGWVQARIIATAWTSGTVSVTWNSTPGEHLVIPYSSNPANMNVTSYLNDGSGNAITSTTINSKQRLDVDLSSEGADGAAAPFNTGQSGGKDPSGNLQAFITVSSGEQFVRDVINISSQYKAQSVTTTAAQALGGASILANRKLINVTPTNGTIYWGTNNSVTTTTGAPIFANQTLSLSFTDNVQVWVISAGTVDCRVMEAS